MAASGNTRGAAVALLAMGLYATHDTVIKILGEHYPSFQILFFSSLLSFPLVAVILLQDSTHGNLRPAHPGWVAFRTLCTVMTGVCGFYAFSTLPLAQVYAILFASPLLVTILSIPILGESVGIHRWGAVIVGLIGVMIVLQPGSAPLALGHAAALLAAVCNAAGSVVVRRLGQSERPVVLMMWPMLGNFALTGAALTMDYKPMELQDMALAGLIACLGLIAGFLLIKAYRLGEAAVVAPMQYSQILWATIYGWFLFGERLDRPTIIGASVIIMSGVYIVWREGSGGNSENRPVTAARIRTESVTAPKSAVLGRLLPSRARRSDKP